ncbi:MAG: glycosyltransferase family 39 protein [Sedimentisphaerales bacterium]|nr:glycosyltransferase family 39 protein [Sedimentisphaerales bacterium]
MKKSRHILWFFILALVVRILFWVWTASGIYFQKQSIGVDLREAKFMNGYGIAAGYGYRHYYDEAHDLMKKVMDEINAHQIHQLNSDNAPLLPQKYHYPNVRHPPGLSLLVCFFHKILGGPADPYVLTLTMILDSLSAVMLWLIVESVLGRRVATITCLAYIFCLPILYHVAWARTSTGLMGFFLIATVGSVLKAVKTQNRFAFLWFVLAGICLGIAGYFRSDYIVLPVFIIPGLLLVRKKWFYALSRTALMMLVTVAVLLPWGYRNHRIFNRWIFTSAIAPAAFYAGLGEFKNPWGLITDDRLLQEEARANGYSHAWTPEANDYFKRRFIDCVKQHPLGWIKSVLRRAPFIIATPYYWGFDPPQRSLTYVKPLVNNKDRYDTLFDNPLNMIRTFWDRILMALIVFLSLIGIIVMFITYPQDKGLLLILIAPHLCALIMHALIHWQSRYTVPSLFCWLIGLAYLINTVIFRNRQTSGN